MTDYELNKRLNSADKRYLDGLARIQKAALEDSKERLLTVIGLEVILANLRLARRPIGKIG
jgi:hypothetical protein